MTSAGGSLAGRTIVVTGAAAGQGAAAALLLHELGARVVATDLGDVVPAAFEGTAIRYRRLDVSSEADWTALAEQLVDSGAVHGLVNNAGITHRARLGALTREDWDRVIAVNLSGAMLGIQALSPLMVAGSSIVNVGSTAALTGH
ncbi:hypothetical protein GCM10009776_00690 [Microbacterium deminutum]|uniref:Uncharacterized protein n=1 Tax=Microbacterium deminutum TaxID=344164 RepID=A0ABN2Q3E4_9MICO